VSDCSHELRAKCDADLHREFTLICAAYGHEYQEVLRQLARWYVESRRHAAMVIVNGLKSQGNGEGTQRGKRSPPPPFSFDLEHPGQGA